MNVLASKYFWLITISLLVWALAYMVLVYFSFTSSSPQNLTKLVDNGIIKQEYADYIARIPYWVKVITLILAISRLLGALGLMFHKQWALPVYALALVLTLVIMYRGFFVANVASVIRTSQILVEIGFILISVFSVWFAASRITIV